MKSLLTAVSIGLVGVFVTSTTADDRKVELLQFNRDIRPILSDNCFECHGPDGGVREADLRLDTEDGIFARLDDGAHVVAPRNLVQSRLFQRITASDSKERMPPLDSGKRLTPQQVELIRRWIEQGAEWQGHWSYIPPRRPKPPTVRNPHRVANAVDQFIQARLDAEGLTLSAAADPITLIRRLSFDLTGLPPSVADVETFVSDASATAYESLVDRLLDSEHYGERMAMYWLDLVRYADSGGYHSDNEHSISPYRDYVINAFNDNLPFDRFTREQLAGDLLPNASIEQRIASGYNRLNKTTEEGGAQPGEYLVKYAADRNRTTAGTWLAATLGCAECHDHKFDPYTMQDFYGFAAFFADIDEVGKYGGGGSRPPELMVPNRRQAGELRNIDTTIQRLAPQAASADGGDFERIAAKIKQLEAQKKAIEKNFTRTMVTVSVAPRETRILPRGNWLDRTGRVVLPQTPAFLHQPVINKTRLNRLDLANWLVARDNPLTARVFVNRLWKLFFGRGLSKSLDDLGVRGEWPTHPELLDWLAVEFMESGWNVKHVVRILVISNAYRQSSLSSQRLREADPLNRLYARQSRWRLDAELIRDNALAVSGLLTRKIGGPSVRPYQPAGYWSHLNFPKRTWKHEAGEDQYRRGLYTHWQRTFLHPSLLAFDAPSREECTAERPVSNTPKAALTLLNDPTYVEAARVFASAALKQGGSTTAGRIDWIYRRALSRPADVDEFDLLSRLYQENLVFYQHDRQAANALLAVGLAKAPAKLDPVLLASWTAVTRVVLNLNETITRN